MAILKISNDVINEDPNTPNHSNRIALAQAAMRDPSGYMRAMYSYIIMQPGINDFGADSSQIDDQTIINAVSAMWDLFAGSPNPTPAAMMVPPVPRPPMLMPA